MRNVFTGKVGTREEDKMKVAANMKKMGIYENVTKIYRTNFIINTVCLSYELTKIVSEYSS